MSVEQSQHPAMLYHYTSIECFRNIIQERKMRATRYDQMNDTSEILLGINNLLGAISHYKIDDSLQKYKDYLLGAINGFRDNVLEVYVLSFSAVADSLEQWRAYSPNGGVAIDFDFKKVKTGFLCDISGHIGGLKVDDPIRPDPSNCLIRCEYTNPNGYTDLNSISRVIGESCT